MRDEERDTLQQLIAETWRWLGFHKARKAAGRIEALACHIRLQALRAALAALDEASSP